MRFPRPLFTVCSSSLSRSGSFVIRRSIRLFCEFAALGGLKLCALRLLFCYCSRLSFQRQSFRELLLTSRRFLRGPYTLFRSLRVIPTRVNSALRCSHTGSRLGQLCRGRKRVWAQ